RSAYGNVTAVERRFGRLTLGFFGACGTASSQMNLPTSSISSDSWHLGMYMSSPLAWRMFVDVTAFYGEADNIIRSTEQVGGVNYSTRAKTETQEWLTQVGMGAQLAPTGSLWSIVPSIRFAYAGVHQAGMTETGAGELGIIADQRWNATALSRMGLDISKEGKLFKRPVRASLLAAWVHDFAASGRTLGVRWQGAADIPWTISSQARSADSLRLGSSVEFTLGARRTMRLYAERDFSEGNRALTGGVTFTIGF
ncbi:MAG: autotransporter outer membrane beta-barrel domain-containing protein, partial [Verrucomicrobia bacterium]|nr:autotransporter outer membrane beta-barrel domain-containing protein [Verrucomicrobiota bacterium]